MSRSHPYPLTGERGRIAGHVLPVVSIRRRDELNVMLDRSNSYSRMLAWSAIVNDDYMVQGRFPDLRKESESERDCQFEAGQFPKSLEHVTNSSICGQTNAPLKVAFASETWRAVKERERRGKGCIPILRTQVEDTRP